MTSDEELIARVREALALLPPVLLRDGDGRLMQHEAATSAYEALDTLARRLEELKDGLTVIAEVGPDTHLFQVRHIARSLLHLEPQEEKE